MFLNALFEKNLHNTHITYTGTATFEKNFRITHIKIIVLKILTFEEDFHTTHKLLVLKQLH